MSFSQTLMSIDETTGLPFVFLLVAVAVVGAAVGSFLNVVIHRVPRDESIVFPHSRCPACGAAIRPYDNVPIVSWLVLRGRCRSCGVRISPRYPAVEALTAALFAVTFLARPSVSPSLGFDLAFVAALVALVFIDAEHQILPNVITYPGTALALAARLLAHNLYGVGFLCAPDSCPPHWLLSLVNALLGAAIAGGFLWGVGWLWERARKEEAMGLGDVKMMFMVGAYLGWPLAVLTIFIGVLSGSLVGLGLIATGRGDLKSKLPFGVYLGIGAFLSLLYGRAVVDWYVSQF